MRAIVDWLLLFSRMGSANGVKIWPISECNYKASFVVCVIVTYSDSVVDSKMISCFFDAYETAPPSMRKA